MQKDYGFVLELSKMPTNWSEFTEKNFNDYSQGCEDCQDRPYTRKTKKYGIVHKELSSEFKDTSDESFFLFLKSKEEKDRVIETFPDLVINTEPFKTVI